MSKIKLIGTKDAAQWKEKNEAVFIDVRTTNEVVSLNIPGSEYVPVPLVSEKRLQPLATLDKKMVFYCHSGNRSATVVDQFGAINGGEVYSLDGGIVAWEKNGFNTETISSVISVERQTHITVGFLIVSSLILGVTIDKTFLIATAFFGSGLIFAGLSGSCLMGILLGKMPWNKR